MLYSSRHIADFFNVSHETVRVWSLEFERHLSTHANPGAGRHRQFTADDLRVFALISEMKAKRFTYADIQATLETGQRGDLPVPEGSALVPQEQQLQVTLLQDTIVKLQGEREELQNKIRTFEDEHIRFQARLETIKEMHEERNRELDARLKEALDKIDQLNREIGRLEAKSDSP